MKIWKSIKFSDFIIRKVNCIKLILKNIIISFFFLELFPRFWWGWTLEISCVATFLQCSLNIFIRYDQRLFKNIYCEHFKLHNSSRHHVIYEYLWYNNIELKLNSMLIHSFNGTVVYYSKGSITMVTTLTASEKVI